MLLAKMLEGQRRWHESDTVSLKAIEQSKMAMGEEDPLTRRTMRLYALSLWSQGRWREAVLGFYRSSRLKTHLRCASLFDLGA